MLCNQGNFDKAAKLVENCNYVLRSITFLITKQRNRFGVYAIVFFNLFIVLIMFFGITNMNTITKMQFIIGLLIIFITEAIMIIFLSSSMKLKAKLTCLNKGVLLELIENNKTIEKYTFIYYKVLYSKQYFKSYKNIILFDIDERKICIRKPIYEYETNESSSIYRFDIRFDFFTIAIDSNKSLEDILSFLDTCTFLDIGITR